MSTKKQYLTDAERDELRSKYAEDKLNNAPANTTDKLFINNYGTDEQKARLSDPNFDYDVFIGAKSPSGTADDKGETQESTTEENDSNSEGVNIDANAEDSTEFAHQVELYQKLHGGELPDEKWDLDEITAANVTKQNQNGVLAGTADPKAAELANVINEHIRLFGKKPFSGWGLDEIKNAIQAEKDRVEKEKADAANEVPKGAILANGGDKLRIQSRKDGRIKKVTQQAYDEYISKSQADEWVLVPAEIQNK